MPAIRPRADVLRDAARAFEGAVYRARPRQWPYPLDSRGSLLYGARFNPPGLFAPLYTSLDPWTACLELLDHTDEQADNIHVYELRVQLAAWDRHVMDPPGLVGTPAVPWGRPPGNAANLVILDSTRLPEPATLPAIYMGHVMLVWP